MKQRDITPYNILKKGSSGSKNGGKNSESDNKNGNFTRGVAFFFLLLSVNYGSTFQLKY